VTRTARESRGRPAKAGNPPRDCPLCPRLVAYRKLWQEREPTWHNAPVRAFGAENARLLIVGLAPGLRGANRTGRPFTGDYAGDLLYATLLKFGFAHGVYRADPADGIELLDCAIANAVACVPPENKPDTTEINTCRRFLAAGIAARPRLEAVVALGRIAHDTTLRAVAERPSRFPFAHGSAHDVGKLRLFDSYHCSRYNTNTGRLTAEMFEAVFAQVRAALGRDRGVGPTRRAP
jgi:uracil-DNA glycosylase